MKMDVLCTIQTSYWVGYSILQRQREEISEKASADESTSAPQLCEYDKIRAPATRRNFAFSLSYIYRKEWEGV